MEIIVLEWRDELRVEACISWELLTCCSGASDGFISFQGRLETEELIFKEEKLQETQMKNLLVWGRSDKVHCDYIDFILPCSAGTSPCLFLLLKRRKGGADTALLSVSQYSVTSRITPSSFFLTFWHPHWSRMGLTRYSGTAVHFSSAAHPCAGCAHCKMHTVPHAVPSSCLCSVPTAPPWVASTGNGVSELDVVL